MKRIQILAAASIAATLATPVQAATTLTEWGTLASVFTSDCAAPCADLVTSVLPALLDPGAGFAIDGDVNQLSASTSLSDARGSVEAHADVVGGLNTPHLRVAASSGADTFVGGAAAAVQGYEYTGTGESITFDVALTGSVTNTAGIQTELGALVFLFTPTQLGTYLSDPVNLPTNAFGAFNMAFEFLGDPDVTDAIPDNPDLNLPNPFAERSTNPAVNLTDSVSIVLPDGSGGTAQQFYLAAFLYGFADGDGNSVSSLNSLSVNFAAGTDLSNLAAAGVPLPAPVWLLGAGLLTLLTRRRPRIGGHIG